MNRPFRILLIIISVFLAVSAAVSILVFFMGRRISSVDIWLEETDSGRTVKLTDGGFNVQPCLSPDGKKVVYCRKADGPEGKEARDILVMTIQYRSSRTALSDGRFNSSPSWGPWGRTIAFISDRDGQRDIFRMDLGTGQAAPLTDDPVSESGARFSPDGRWILFTQEADNGIEEVFVIPSEGGSKVRLTGTRNMIFYPKDPAWTPDSKKIVFASLVYLVSLDMESGKMDTVDLAGLNNISSPAADPRDPDRLVVKARPARELSFQMYLYSVSSGTGLYEVMRKSSFFENGTRFSRDGKYMVYSR